MSNSDFNKHPFKIIKKWYDKMGWSPFDFQFKTWKNYLDGKDGLLNAPTGSGKTYAIWLACLMEYFAKDEVKDLAGLKVIWVTPLRALSKDLASALQVACDSLGVPWSVEIRTGDTSAEEKKNQIKKMPDCLVTTPESLHILFSHNGHGKYFRNTYTIIVDEWHDLLSTKRGVQMELAISRVRAMSKFRVSVWGISATIGNLNEAMHSLLGKGYNTDAEVIVAQIEKHISIKSILPDDINKFPWAGHVGIKLLDKIIPVIKKSKSTLLFTNTRSQAEIWYRAILNEAPDLAGVIAMHHGSIDMALRRWVEDALKAGKLKLVVCTSSLDLGVDFAPVDTVIQVGGPKGVSRFFQRAGRSGHQPGALSQIYFVPTHALEIIEGAALKMAKSKSIHEDRSPLINSLDVLVQYLVTLAVGGGFSPDEVFHEVRTTHAYQNLNEKEWTWILAFISTGGKSLEEYEDFNRVIKSGSQFLVERRKVAQRHRLSIGTIVGDPILQVRLISGGYLGTIEESFISQLNPGTTFWFSGRCLEFVKVKDMTAIVRKSNKKSGQIPQWMGGRLPLSSKLSDLIRVKLEEASRGVFEDEELQVLKPVFEIQSRYSVIPNRDELLIESIHSKEGHHIFIYPFEGRFVHEVLSAVVAYRISKITPISFSIAMNDYGFELLSDQEIPIDEALEMDLFTMENIMEDIENSINKGELAKRRFRDIATISGLIFQGYPGQRIANKHLQASSSIIFDVFEQYDHGNLLVKQAKEEVISLQLDLSRLIEGMRKIDRQKLILVNPDRATPFSFPIMADRLREKFSSEKLADRLLRMQQQMQAN